MKPKSSSVWNQSPCTLAFPQRNILFQKQQRFSFQSIYYKQKVHPKLKFKLQIIRPQSCLIDFRRQLQQCQKFRRKLSTHSKSMHLLKKIDNIQLSPPKAAPSQFQQAIIQRLTLNQPIQIDQIYDRNGIRSTFYTSNGQQKLRYSFKKSKSVQPFIERKVKGPKVYVSGSARIDLSKPQNFNPGPGSYFLDKRDNQQISQLYRRAHKSSRQKIKQSIQTHRITVPQQQKQNFNFFKTIFAKAKNNSEKSKLGRVSTAIKSKPQFTFFNIN